MGSLPSTIQHLVGIRNTHFLRDYPSKTKGYILISFSLFSAELEYIWWQRC